MTSPLGYFRWPVAFTIFGLILAFFLGYRTDGTWAGAFSFH